MSKDKILDRIQKLLRLADNNPSVEEAALAAQRAQELMFEHKISMAEVALDGEDEPVVDEKIEAETKRVPIWLASLWHAVARHNFAKAVYCNPRHGAAVKAYIRVFGTSQDVAAVKYLVAYLQREIEQLAEQYWTQLQLELELDRQHVEARYWSGEWDRDKAALELAAVDKRKPKPRAWGNAFRVGAVEVIYHRLADQRRRQESELRDRTSTALVKVQQQDTRVEEYARKKIGRTRPGRGARVSDSTGRMAGADAARGINLDRGRGLKAPAKQLGQ